MRARIAIAGLAAAAAVAVTAGAASASVLPPAPAELAPAVVPVFPVSATAVTLITNDPDSGHGTPANWATDTIFRIVTVTRGSAEPAFACGTTSGPCYAYTATLHDAGSFDTIPGAGTPNQSCTGCAGEKIRREVTGSIQGSYTVTFNASSGSPSAARVKPAHNDHGNAAVAPYTSTTWGEQFFPGGTSFSTPVGGAYNWTYTVPSWPLQRWVDASTNNDGSTTGPGNNITG